MITSKGVARCEDGINIRYSLTILCRCHHDEMIIKYQVNQHKTRYILSSS